MPHGEEEVKRHKIMKQIGNLIRKRQTEIASPHSLQESYPLALVAKAMYTVKKFGEPEKFLKDYNSDLQVKCAANQKEVYMCRAYPSMQVLGIAYGKNVAAAWVLGQLERVNRSSNSKNKLTDEQVQDIAETFVEDPRIKLLMITEIALFFYLLSTGAYGDLYGRLDTTTILTKLRNEFLTQRANEIAHYEYEAEKERKEREMADAITWEEYQRRKQLKQQTNGNTSNLQQPDKTSVEFAHQDPVGA